MLAHPGVCSATEQVEEESEAVPAQGRPEVESVTKLMKMGILHMHSNTIIMTVYHTLQSCCPPILHSGTSI